MRVAIPVEENNLEGDICSTFARTPYFMIYETLTGKSNFVDNDAKDCEQGAGIKAAQFILDQKIDILLTAKCGESADTMLKSGQVKVYKAKGKSSSENLSLLKANDLKILGELDVTFKGSIDKHRGI